MCVPIMTGSRVLRLVLRESFDLSVSAFVKAAYQTEIESWRELPGDRIEFTVRRLPSAD